MRGMKQFDFIFCRNVLIYFDQPTKTRVLEAIAGLMAEIGADGINGDTQDGVPLAFPAAR